MVIEEDDEAEVERERLAFVRAGRWGRIWKLICWGALFPFGLLAILFSFLSSA